MSTPSSNKRTVVANITVDDAKQILRENQGGRYEEHWGPYSIGGYRIWEIWASDGDYHVRFATRDASGTEGYFPDFSALCTVIDQQRQKDLATGLLNKVAAAAFLLAAATVAWTVAKSDFSSMLPTVWASLAGLVASGGAYYYGKTSRTR
jgi:hypothetical protein